MSTNCLVTKLKASVNNATLAKIGEVVFELVNQPSEYPQRSGYVTTVNTAIPVTVRVMSNDNITFSNGKGKSFVIDNAETQANRGLGTSQNAKVGIYPGDNFTLNQVNDHFKEIPTSICYMTGLTTLTFAVTPDYMGSDYLFGINDIKRLFTAPNVRSLEFTNNSAYQGTIEDIIIAANNAYKASRPDMPFAINIGGNQLVGLTFHGNTTPASSVFFFHTKEGNIEVYNNAQHYGESEYLIATYNGTSWVYNS